MHKSRARSGGLWYSPTMSRTLSMKCGSVESLNVSLRWGASEKARQMRDMALWLMPSSLAKRRVLSSVVAITCSMCSSRMLRGTPGCGASAKPSMLFSAKRRRHLPTVRLLMPSRAAIAKLVLLGPAQASTMRASSARP